MSEKTYIERENKVRLWFEMWLQKENKGIEEIFSETAIYIESWGPQYDNLSEITYWFNEWNQRGTVKKWDILEFTHNKNKTFVEWKFFCEMNNGEIQKFDGVSIIKWNEFNKIIYLKEFGCNDDTYNPYKEERKIKKYNWF